MEETSHIRGPKSPAGVMPTHTPSVVLSAKEKETSLPFTNKDYKGLPARNHRKVQTRCHLRGNFPCLGEERAPMKSTESSANIATKLIGIARDSPQTARVRRDALLASFLLASPPPKILRGVKLADNTLRRHLSKSSLIADEDGVQNDDETRHCPHARDA